MLHILKEVYTCVQLGSTYTVLYVHVMWCYVMSLSPHISPVMSIKLFVHFRKTWWFQKMPRVFQNIPGYDSRFLNFPCPIVEVDGWVSSSNADHHSVVGWPLPAYKHIKMCPSPLMMFVIESKRLTVVFFFLMCIKKKRWRSVRKSRSNS